MDLIYFSPVPWASFAQRPHKFVEWFHRRTGEKVLWIEPYPTRLPVVRDLLDIITSKPRKHETAEKTPAWLTVIKPFALPIEPLPLLGRLNQIFWKHILANVNDFSQAKCLIVVGKPSALALQVLKEIPSHDSIYDAMDNFPAFYSGISKRSMRNREKVLEAQVDKILVASTLLARRFDDNADKVYTVLNACDPIEISAINRFPQNSKSVIIGYVGTIAKWFDWNLIIALAQANPLAIIRLIGPIYGSPPANLPSNIELHPACRHHEALTAMSSFSIGLIPFKKNELTDFVDPIKYYEYRALGLPIISTKFGEMSLHNNVPGIFLIEQNSNLQDIVNKALEFKMTETQQQDFQATHSWDKRFDSVWSSF